MTVAVQLPANAAFQDIFTWDESASSFSADRAATAAFDYFTDDFTVDDAIYFALPNTSDYFCSLYFNVGTAIAATSYTLVWEYYNGSSWTALSGLVDDTNSFATTGQNYVHWRPSLDWDDSTVNGAAGIWVRARVSAVDTPTEGGANTTDTVKQKQAIIQISGGTEGTPATMDDVMACAEITDWDLVIKTGPVYTLYADLIQTDAGYFKQTNAIFNFQYGKLNATGSNYNATFIFGLADALLPRTGRNGCYVVVGRGKNDTGNIYWPKIIAYNTLFRQSSGHIYSTPNGCEFYGCSFQQVYMGARDTLLTDCVLYQLTTYNTSSGYVWTVDGGSFRSIYASQNQDGFLARNIDSIGSWSWRWNAKFVLYDCDDPGSAPTYGPAGNWSQGDVSDAYQHYSLTITVQDQDATPIVGATVDLKDQNGDLAQKWSGTLAGGSIVDVTTLTTDANGQVTTDILYNHHKHEALVDDVVTLTTTSYNPFTVTIAKAGYLTRALLYTMDRKREEIEMMHPYDALQTSAITGTVDSPQALAATLITLDELSATLTALDELAATLDTTDELTGELIATDELSGETS